MSRASKIFLASATLVSGVTVWGVHFLQKRESDTMYQGVLKDEARLREKALALSSSSSPSSSSLGAVIIAKDHVPPLNTPSSPVSPVSQPAPVVDEDCEVCRISPPPTLLEAQSRDARRIEREARAQEYEAQKALAGRLGKEQSSPSALPPSDVRLV